MRHRLSFLYFCLLVLSLLSPAQPLAAQAGPQAMRADLQDTVALEAFVDGLMATHLEQFLVPGVVISIVHDGELVLAKGYGYADLENRIPVEAETTLFRIGSITKMLTWTAAMQLVEEGRLDLEADVNTYLTNVHVPGTYIEPITMLDLMAHTPGFEDRSLGLFARSPDALAPLESLLIDDLPKRVRPPGVLSAYSNHGSALAALVVSEISGLSWEEYVEMHILQPLGMTRTTVRQPVPDALAGDLSNGYSVQGGRPQNEGFEYVPLAPAGSASATATDMAQFMLAHLQLGQLGETRILQEATARQMQTQHFTHDPLLPGLAHGFIEADFMGERWIGHGGDTLWFHSIMLLSPEHNIGIFLSTNGANGGQVLQQFVTAWTERYFGAENGIEANPPTATTQQLARFAGDYRTIRIAHTTPDKIAGLFGSLTIGVDPDGYLTLGGLGQPSQRLTEVGPGRFRTLEFTGELGNDEVVFQFDEAAQPQLLFLSPIPIMVFERLAWYEGTLLHMLLFAGALLLFLGVVIAWPIQIWRDRKRPGRRTRWVRAARWIGWITALILLVYQIGFIIAFRDPILAVFGVPPIFTVIGWFPILAIPLTLVMLVGVILVWRERAWRLGGRIFYTLAAFTAVAILWQLWYWNFLLAPLIL